MASSTAPTYAQRAGELVAAYLADSGAHNALAAAARDGKEWARSVFSVDFMLNATSRERSDFEAARTYFAAYVPPIASLGTLEEGTARAVLNVFKRLDDSAFRKAMEKNDLPAAAAACRRLKEDFGNAEQHPQLNKYSRYLSFGGDAPPAIADPARSLNDDLAEVLDLMPSLAEAAGKASAEHDENDGVEGLVRDIVSLQSKVDTVGEELKQEKETTASLQKELSEAKGKTGDQERGLVFQMYSDSSPGEWSAQASA